MNIQYTIFVNGQLFQKVIRMALFGLEGGTTPRPLIFDTLAEAEKAAADMRDDLRTSFHLEPIIQIGRRYCTDWHAGELADGLAEAFENYLHQNGDI